MKKSNDVRCDARYHLEIYADTAVGMSNTVPFLAPAVTSYLIFRVFL